MNDDWGRLAVGLISVGGAAWFFVRIVLRYDRYFVDDAEARLTKLRVDLDNETRRCDALQAEVQALRREVWDLQHEVRRGNP